jgi:large subunit ribosomal protein L13
MKTPSFQTFNAKPDEVERDWFVVDADGKTVGRLASRIATVLRGKHKPTYTPHVDTGDHVIVVNADKVAFTGRKETLKEYTFYSGFPGGDKKKSPEDLREKRPEFFMRHAVKGMLPRGPLGRKMLKKLRVYTGSEHPHDAQQPKPLDEA